MGFGPKAPDTSAQQKELKRQEEEARRKADLEAQRTQKEYLAARRGMRGRQSLIKNEGGELGVKNKLGL